MKLMFGALLSLCLVTPAFSSSISQVTGEFVHGGGVVVTGDGFGSGAGLENLVYDSFDRSSMSTNATVGRWRTTYSLSIANESRHPRATRAAYHNFLDENYGAVGTVDNVLSARWFAQYWVRLADWSWGSTDYSGNRRHLANVKVIRFWHPSSDPQNVVGATLLGPNEIVYWTTEAVSGGGWADTTVTKNMLSDGSWHLLQFEFADSSVPGSSDGQFRIWFDGKLVSERTGFKSRTTSNLKRLFLLGFYNSWGPNTGAGETNRGPNRFYMHDVYAAPTWARVEIGDSPVYNNCSVREIQVPTQWGNNEVRFTLNQGSFESGSPAYLFVVNSDGVPSAGRLIQIGDGAAPPNAPGGVRVD